MKGRNFSVLSSFVLASFFFSLSASAQDEWHLTCSTAAGSQVDTIIGESGRLVNTKIQIRGEAMKLVEGAKAPVAILDGDDDHSEPMKLNAIVITDPNGAIITAITNGILVDKMGAYPADCSVDDVR